MESQIILALDGMAVGHATSIALNLRDIVAGGKGNDLIDEGGASVLNHMRFKLRMADPKLHDIPATVANRMSKYLGNAEFVTVHGSNSFAALKAAAKTAKEKDLKAIAITVTTDLKTEQCKLIYGLPTRKKVLQFVKRARRAGLHGIVCSPREVKLVRASWPKSIIIVPGVRSPGASVHDQKRVGTPYQAVLDGADYIVVGRQITQQTTDWDMRLEAQKINRETSLAADHRCLAKRKIAA
jgi:orotidine-5'-phosphate decarboxylase